MFAHPLGEGAELRALEPWNAAEFTAHVDESRPHLAPWLPWVTTVTDETAAREWLQAYADRQARDAGRIYGIWLDGVLTGGTLFRVFDAAAGTCEVGVWLAPHAEGRGLVTAAARHMIAWAFTRGVVRVEWRCTTENTRSAAVAKRLGMVRDGVLRQAFQLHGVRHDVEVWSLLAPEWQR